MPTRLPTAADLPRRWGPEEASAVLAALESSGLTPTEFARQTGIQLQRLRRWRERVSPEPVHLVEVVPRGSAPAEALDVVSPSGWRLRVPGALLGELVRALSERAC